MSDFRLKKGYQNSSEAKIQIHVGQPSKTVQTVDFAKPLYILETIIFLFLNVILPGVVT